MIEGDAKLPILRARPSEIAARVLVVGDPARARQASGLLEQAVRVASNREYDTWSGTFEGTPITVCSHGVGSAGAGVCFEEVARAGARWLVRAGTCGALREDIADGDLIVATGAVRDEGLTPRLVPIEFPAVADALVVGALGEAASGKAARPAHRGVVLTSDLFYPSKCLGVDWTRWQKSGVLAVEMELSALLIISALHGLAAGGLFTVDGNPTRAAQDMSEYDPYRSVVQEGVAEMLETALRALVSLPDSAPRP